MRGRGRRFRRAPTREERAEAEKVAERVRRRQERERREGLDPKDEAARWLAEHDRNDEKED